MNRIASGGEERSDPPTPEGPEARARILVVGSASAWLDGVVDLIQLAGYEVRLEPDWQEAEREIRDAAPDLIILDLSEHVDSLDLPQRLSALLPTGNLPILLLNSTGDDCIWHLERVGDPTRGRVDLYAHSLLGPSALLDKVESCLTPPAAVATG